MFVSFYVEKVYKYVCTYFKIEWKFPFHFTLNSFAQTHAQSAINCICDLCCLSS